jgi:hypothetical protein
MARQTTCMGRSDEAKGAILIAVSSRVYYRDFSGELLIHAADILS